MNEDLYICPIGNRDFPDCHFCGWYMIGILYKTPQMFNYEVSNCIIIVLSYCLIVKCCCDRGQYVFKLISQMTSSLFKGSTPYRCTLAVQLAFNIPAV